MFDILFIVALLVTCIQYYALPSRLSRKYEDLSPQYAKIQRKKFLTALFAGLASSIAWAYLAFYPNVVITINDDPLPISGMLFAALIGSIAAVYSWSFTLYCLIKLIPDTRGYRAAKKSWAIS